MWPEHIQCMTTHRLPHSIRHRGGDLQLLVSGLHPRSSDPSHGADNGVHTHADAARGGRRCEKNRPLCRRCPRLLRSQTVLARSAAPCSDARSVFSASTGASDDCDLP
jgi:hypothetical protein